MQIIYSFYLGLNNINSNQSVSRKENRFQSVAIPMKVNVSSVAGWYAVPFTMFPFSKLAWNIDPNSSSNVQVLLPLSITPLIVATWAVSSLTLPGKKIKGH